MAVLPKNMNDSNAYRVRDEHGVHTRVGPRFKVLKKASCIVRNKNMRFLSFEMFLTDVSEMGVGLYDPSKTSFEYKVGDTLLVTLDCTSQFFPRPIWAVYQVRKITKDANGAKSYGLQLISVDSMHQAAYRKGLSRVEQDGVLT